MIAKLDEAHINMVLLTNHVGRLACCFNGQPYIVPVTYVFRDDCIYGHTNRGEKLRILRQNPRVCFEVDDVKDLASWQSVVARGTFEELSGRDATQALDILFAGLTPLVAELRESRREGNPVDAVQHGLRMRSTKGVVYRVRLTEKTGRYERRFLGQTSPPEVSPRQPKDESRHANTGSLDPS